MAARRTVVTGWGMITPLAGSAEHTFELASQGRSGIRELTAFPAEGLPCRVAGQVDDSWIDPAPPDLDPHLASRPLRLMLTAAREATDMAGLAEVADRSRISVVLGAHGSNPEVADLARLHASAAGPDSWLTSRAAAAIGEAAHQLRRRKPDLLAAVLAQRAGARGAAVGVASACAAGAQAVGEGHHMIADGTADVVVAGGTESNLNFVGFIGFVLLRALTERWPSPAEASRPFDRRRNGFVMAEGAGLLVLEELAHAVDRGAPILGEVLGYGDSADAYRLTDPRPDGRGAVLAMASALADAGRGADDVEVINAHGTSTVLGDAAEVRAIRMVLGERSVAVPVTSTKSMMGHTIAAAGAIEAILTLQGLARSVLLPTINYRYPDPRCNVDVVAREARAVDHRVALSNSFGFGGQNACLCLGRWEGAR